MAYRLLAGLCNTKMQSMSRTIDFVSNVQRSCVAECGQRLGPPNILSTHAKTPFTTAIDNIIYIK